MIQSADLTSFDLTINAPVDNPECVTAYTITTNGGGDPITVNGTTPIVQNLPGFDVCTHGDTFNFTVVPHTLNGDGPSATVDQNAGYSL